MQLEGSCHCGAVRFSVRSSHPYPFNLCYCSICRKTAGSGGFAINLGAETDTLRVEGEEHIRTYHARLHDPAEVPTDPTHAERSATGMYRTTPLRALWQHPPYFHDGSAAALADVVERYDAAGGLSLTVSEEADLVEYLKSL